MKILFRGGTIVDGTGKPGFRGDLLVEGDKIAGIRRESEPDPGWELGPDALILDADGLVVAPGFIDTHSHSDLYCLSHPQVLPKVMQGVTTEIVGQDGLGAAPVPEGTAGQGGFGNAPSDAGIFKEWKEFLLPLDGSMDEKDRESFRTLSAYLDLVDRTGPGPNIGCCLPHGNVRVSVLGTGAVKPDEGQLHAMEDLTLRDLQEGAFGLSTGLIYPPCSYAETEELVAICRGAAKAGRRLVIHQRSEADDIISSMQEVFDICRRSGAGVHFSHFKVCGRKNEQKLPQMLALLDQAEREGIEVTFDQYPYPMGSTMLSACLPPDAKTGGPDGMMAILSDPAGRKRIRQEILTDDNSWDNFFSFAGPDHIYISGVRTEKNQSKVGKSLTELAQILGKAACDVLFDLLLEEKGDVSMVDFYGTENQVRTLLLRPEMNVCTDGLYSGHPHPRLYGTYPRILGKYVREEKLLTLEAAIRKMTGKPAETFAIKGRGKIREGYQADLVVFDPAEVADTATFESPGQYPRGIHCVCVNGIPEVLHGQPTGNCGGRALRRQDS